MLLVSLAGALSSHWHGVRKSWGGPGDRSHHSVAGGGSMQARAGKQWWDSLCPSSVSASLCKPRVQWALCLPVSGLRVSACPLLE